MRIRNGDTVKILYGNDSGKTGKVLNVDSKKLMVVVDGINVKRKHIKGDGQKKKSEVISIVKPMPISKVMLIDPESGKPSRVRYEVKKDGKERVSVRSGKSIDTVGSKKKVTTKKSSKKKVATKKTVTKKKSPTKKTATKGKTTTKKTTKSKSKKK